MEIQKHTMAGPSETIAIIIIKIRIVVALQVPGSKNSKFNASSPASGYPIHVPLYPMTVEITTSASYNL
jgi:hypothetical protein